MILLVDLHIVVEVRAPFVRLAVVLGIGADLPGVSHATPDLEVLHALANGGDAGPRNWIGSMSTSS